MIDNETAMEIQSYDNRLRSQGLSLDMYLKYTGMTMEQMEEQFRPNAEKQVKLRLGLEKIAELENIEVSDEELEEEYANIAKTYNIETEEVKARILADDIRADLKVKKAIELVEAAAVPPKADAE